MSDSRVPSPADFVKAWEDMTKRAITIMRVAEQEQGVDPLDLDSEEGRSMAAGIALGISAAAGFYSENPQLRPPGH